MKTEKVQYKKGVDRDLLDKCAGTDLNAKRIIRRDNESRVERVIYGVDGTTMEVDEWKTSLKKAKRQLKN